MIRLCCTCLSTGLPWGLPLWWELVTHRAALKDCNLGVLGLQGFPTCLNPKPQILTSTSLKLYTLLSLGFRASLRRSSTSTSASSRRRRRTEPSRCLCRETWSCYGWPEKRPFQAFGGRRFTWRWGLVATYII